MHPPRIVTEAANGSFDVCPVVAGDLGPALGTFPDVADAQLFALATDHALLLRLFADSRLIWRPSLNQTQGKLCFGGLEYQAEVDVYGCPMISPRLREAIALNEGRTEI